METKFRYLLIRLSKVNRKHINKSLKSFLNFIENYNITNDELLYITYRNAQIYIFNDVKMDKNLSKIIEVIDNFFKDAVLLYFPAKNKSIETLTNDEIKITFYNILMLLISCYKCHFDYEEFN